MKLKQMLKTAQWAMPIMLLITVALMILSIGIFSGTDINSLAVGIIAAVAFFCSFFGLLTFSRIMPYVNKIDRLDEETQKSIQTQTIFAKSIETLSNIILRESKETIKTDHSEIRLHFKWGSFGVNGDKPMTTRTLDQISDNHLEKIKEHVRANLEHFGVKTYLTISTEIRYREENNITVEDYVE